MSQIRCNVKQYEGRFVPTTRTGTLELNLQNKNFADKNKQNKNKKLKKIHNNCCCKYKIHVSKHRVQMWDTK